MQYTHVYLGHNKTYFLQEISRSRKGIIKFEVKKLEYRVKVSGGRKPSKYFSKSFLDHNLYAKETYEDSTQELVNLSGIKFLKRKVLPEDSHLVPKVKKSFIFDKDQISNIMTDIYSDSNIYLVGRTGSGKTLTIQQICARLNIPCIRVQTSGDMTKESLLGSYVPIKNEIVWVDGLITHACRKGYWVILDEWDFAPSSIRTVLNGLLETDNRSLTLTDKEGGEILSKENKRIHPNFRIFATGNTAGCMQDEVDMYGGVSDQNVAQINRFNIYKIDYLKGFDLYKAMKYEAPELTKIMVKKIQNLSDALNESKNPGIFFPTRTSFALIRKLRYHKKLPIMSALESVYLNHLEKSDKDKAMNILKKLEL